MNHVFKTIFNLLGIISSKQIAIGESHLGGIIAYLDNTGKHGIVAASVDQDSKLKWDNGNIDFSRSTGAALGLGKVNTAIIVAKQGAGHYAAKQCFDLVLNGFSDWYLPSKDELDKLCIYKDIIGGFSNKYYWSSTGDDNGAWDQDFLTGYQSYNNKNLPGSVRAVRAF